MAQCSISSCELVRPAPHAAVVVLTGEHDVSTLPLVRQALASLGRDGSLLVVVDLSRATFIDAAVLTALRGAEQALARRGGRLGLLPGSAPTVRRMLELTGWLCGDCVSIEGDHGLWEFLAVRAAG